MPLETPSTPVARGSFPSYVQRLRERVPFTLSRWGDGEWSAILGMSGANCDGHQYTKRLGQDLGSVLMSRPPYDLGLQQLALRRFGRQITTWLERRHLTFDWVNAETFARHSAADQLQPLIDGLRTRIVILVGPAHLAGLRRLFPVAAHIIVPDVNCHDDVRRVTQESAASLARVTSTAIGGAVLAVSASMSANVIIHRLYVQGFRQHTLVDFGSLWEPYVGRATRSYHRRVLAREGHTA